MIDDEDRPSPDSSGWPDHPEETGRDRLRRPLLSRSRLIAGALVAGAIAILVSLAGAPRGEATAAAPIELPARNAWIEINRPIPLYDLRLTGFAPDAFTYGARRHDPGGGRRDSLAAGSWPGGGPVFRLFVYRKGLEAAGPSPLYLEIVRRAADLGLAVTRSGQPDRLPTRFGTFEVADMVLEGHGRDQACLGFRLTGANGDIHLSGFSCGTATQPMQRGLLACQIDGLTLVSAGDDTVLRGFFVEAERRRDDSCTGFRAGRQSASWMEPQGAPVLRGPAADKPSERRPSRKR